MMAFFLRLNLYKSSGAKKGGININPPFFLMEKSFTYLFMISLETLFVPEVPATFTI